MEIKTDFKYIEVEDFSVSNEKFTLFMDEKFQLLKTIPVPDENRLGSYYESADYISHTDSKKSFFDKIYQYFKSKAIQNKFKILEQIQPEKGMLLDIGCGTADFLVEGMHRGWSVIGFEPNKNARKLAISKGITLIDSLKNIQDQSVDAITMWHVLEHVVDLNEQLTALNRILKKDGTLLVAVPNFNSYDAKYYGKFWAAFDVPRHLWHFSQTSIPILFSPYKFKLVETYPMLLDSFYVSLLSEQYKTGKRNWFTAFRVGLRSNIEARNSLEYSSLIYYLKKE